MVSLEIALYSFRLKAMRMWHLQLTPLVLGDVIYGEK